jgi:hypothetical protein
MVFDIKHWFLKIKIITWRYVNSQNGDISWSTLIFCLILYPLVNNFIIHLTLVARQARWKTPTTYIILHFSSLVLLTCRFGFLVSKSAFTSKDCDYERICIICIHWKYVIIRNYSLFIFKCHNLCIWQFYDYFWSLFCQLHRYLSQN